MNACANPPLLATANSVRVVEESKQRVEHVRPWTGDDVTQELRLVHRRIVLTL